MNNLDVRIEMLKANIKVCQLAQKINIARPSLSRKLRYTLSDKEKARLLQAIEELKQENN